MTDYFSPGRRVAVRRGDGSVRWGRLIQDDPLNDGHRRRGYVWVRTGGGTRRRVRADSGALWIPVRSYDGRFRGHSMRTGGYVARSAARAQRLHGLLPALRGGLFGKGAPPRPTCMHVRIGGGMEGAFIALYDVTKGAPAGATFSSRWFGTNTERAHRWWPSSITDEWIWVDAQSGGVQLPVPSASRPVQGQLRLAVEPRVQRDRKPVGFPMLLWRDLNKSDPETNLSLYPDGVLGNQEPISCISASTTTANTGLTSAISEANESQSSSVPIAPPLLPAAKKGGFTRGRRRHHYY